MPTFALEKQTRLVRKQTRFILTLPVAGAVCSGPGICIYIVRGGGGMVSASKEYLYMTVKRDTCMQEFMR